MEKITIRIPDNLTSEEEAKFIAKELGKKMLPGGKTDSQKLLSSGYEIKHLETEIKIIREPVEKPIVSQECSACGTIFELELGKSVWTNYGGKIRKLTYCCDACRDNVINIAGKGRMAIKKIKFIKINVMKNSSDSIEIVGEIYEGRDAYLIKTRLTDSKEAILNIGDWTSNHLSLYDKKKVKIKFSIEVELID